MAVVGSLLRSRLSSHMQVALARLTVPDMVAFLSKS